MLEVVDELMTPGCPQCAVKHLSAALYHRAKTLAPEMPAPDPYMVCVCTAYINLVEVRAGYVSHLWYAVGALVRAEEHFAVGLGECVAREARLMLEQHGEDALIDALRCIEEGTAPTHADWAAAHFDEARRELPAYADMMTMGNIIETIERIRKEFFITDEASAASDESAGEGGETDMTKKVAKTAAKAAVKAVAAKKAPAKKAPAKTADPKAAKAACKGGKCKSGKCK